MPQPPLSPPSTKWLVSGSISKAKEIQSLWLTGVMPFMWDPHRPPNLTLPLPLLIIALSLSYFESFFFFKVYPKESSYYIEPCKIHWFLITRKLIFLFFSLPFQILIKNIEMVQKRLEQGRWDFSSTVVWFLYCSWSGLRCVSLIIHVLHSIWI